MCECKCTLGQRWLNVSERQLWLAPHASPSWGEDCFVEGDALVGTSVWSLKWCSSRVNPKVDMWTSSDWRGCTRCFADWPRLMS